MALEFTYVSFAWFAYAAACVLLIGLFFQAPRLTLGAAGLAALLLQQALGTSAAVVLFSAFGGDAIPLALQAFENGAIAWLLWSPLIFLLAPLVLSGSKWRKLAWGVGLAGTLPSVGLIAYGLLDPEAILVGGSRLSGFASACLLLTFLGFASSVALLALEALTTPAPIRRAQFSLMACALALEGAYHASQNVTKLFVGTDFLGAVTASLTDTLVTLAGGLAFVGIAGWLGYVTFQSEDAQRRRWARAMLVCVFVASVTGAATARLVSGEEFVDPSGLFHAAWDLAGLCLLVFAALRYQLFDIEMKARKAMTVGTALVLGFVTFSTVENVAENFFQATYFGGLPASGSIAAVFVAVMSAFLLKLGQLVAHRALPNVARTLTYEHHRHEELYAAALEGAFLDGIVSPAEANSIKRLREKLGISLDEHHRIEARVRASLT